MKLYSQFSFGVLIHPLVAKTLMDFIGNFIGIKYKFRPFVIQLLGVFWPGYLVKRVCCKGMTKNHGFTRFWMIQMIFWNDSISKISFFSFFPPTYTVTSCYNVCHVSSSLVYFFILLLISKQNGRWMEDGEFSVLHSSLASKSASPKCLEAVITQQQGRSRKDFIISFRISREVLRSQVLWVSWVSGLSCARIQHG